MELSAESSSWARLIASISSPLALFALFLLITQSIVLALIYQAKGRERIVALKGMLVVIAVCAVGLLIILGLRPQTSQTQERGALEETRSFDRLYATTAQIVERLETVPDLLKGYVCDGNALKLYDGLYSDLLFISGSVPSGHLETRYYGNLMELEERTHTLRFRYSKGPYADEVIVRAFPLSGPRQGIASRAVTDGKLLVQNSMSNQLRENGEELLQAMISIPVYSKVDQQKELGPGTIAVINIDSMEPNAFPSETDAAYADLTQRARQLVELTQRVNRLHGKVSDCTVAH